VGAHTDLRVWLRLLACTTLIESRVRRGLRAEFATTLPRFDVMAQLDRATDGLTMGELSRQLMVSNGNVTGIIDRLVTEGLVARRAEARDRRTQRVRLTPAGKSAFDAMTPVHEHWISDALAPLAESDKTRLIDLLDTLKSTLTSDEARP
jgi:DNA-binding MarR family transcriptional regulator